jgi:enamine deaminase RidA (YjgF/YER057c/UK114 family)
LQTAGTMPVQVERIVIMSDIDYKAILPDGWPRPRVFSHAVVASGTRSIRISGQLGKEQGEPQVVKCTDIATQWRLALANLVAVLEPAGGKPGQIVMLRTYVTDLAEFNSSGKAIGEAWNATVGRHFPAMTLVQISALIDPNARVEIEGEAILP